jgi:hypothetical protein
VTADCHCHNLQLLQLRVAVCAHGSAICA